jgi:hypothetical protein
MRAIAYGKRKNMLQTGTLQSNTPFSKQSRNLHLAVGPVAACVVAQTSRQAGAVLASVKQTSKSPTPSLSTGTVSYQSPPLLKDFIFLTQQNNSSFMQDWNIANLIKMSETLPRSLSGNNTSLKCLSRTGFISQYHRTGGWKDDSPASHLECSRSNPSLQRRARLLSRCWTQISTMLGHCSSSRHGGGAGAQVLSKHPHTDSHQIAQCWSQFLNNGRCCFFTCDTTLCRINGIEPDLCWSSGAGILRSSLKTGSAVLDYLRDKLQRALAVPPSLVPSSWLSMFLPPRAHVGRLMAQVTGFLECLLRWC